MEEATGPSLADAPDQTARLKAQAPKTLNAQWLARGAQRHNERGAQTQGTPSQSRATTPHRLALFLGLAIPIERVPIVFPGGARKRGIGRDGERVGGAAQHGDVGMVIAKRA